MEQKSESFKTHVMSTTCLCGGLYQLYRIIEQGTTPEEDAAKKLKD